MCSLFNAVDESYIGSKEIIYTAGPRKRKGSEPEAEPEFDINDI